MKYLVLDLEQSTYHTMEYRMTLYDRFIKKVQLNSTSTYWTWIGCLSSNGYGQITVDKKRKLAHQISYELYIGKIDDDLNICHLCDNRGCVNPMHLWQGTQGQNLKDAYSKGRKSTVFGKLKGELQHLAKLTKESGIDIRKDYIGGASSRALALKYGVCKSSILNVVHKRTWKHV